MGRVETSVVCINAPSVSIRNAHMMLSYAAMNLNCVLMLRYVHCMKCIFFFQNLSSMFAAAAAAASSGQRTASGRFPTNLFQASKRPSGLESPPASLENRSTPGSLDLSRSKDDYLDDMDSDMMPPTMVKMEAMVYPKVDSEDDDNEGQMRLEKRIFGNDGSDEDTVEDLSAPKKPKLENRIDESQKRNQIETPNNGENNNSNTIIHGNSDHEMKLVKNEDNIMEQAQNLISVRDEFKEHKEEQQQNS